jgi:hypothetical protein
MGTHAVLHQHTGGYFPYLRKVSISYLWRGHQKAKDFIRVISKRPGEETQVSETAIYNWEHERCEPKNQELEDPILQVYDILSPLLQIFWIYLLSYRIKLELRKRLTAVNITFLILYLTSLKSRMREIRQSGSVRGRGQWIHG